MLLGYMSCLCQHTSATLLTLKPNRFHTGEQYFLYLKSIKSISHLYSQMPQRLFNARKSEGTRIDSLFESASSGYSRNCSCLFVCFWGGSSPGCFFLLVTNILAPCQQLKPSCLIWKPITVHRIQHESLLIICLVKYKLSLPLLRRCVILNSFLTFFH